MQTPLVLTAAATLRREGLILRDIQTLMAIFGCQLVGRHLALERHMAVRIGMYNAPEVVTEIYSLVVKAEAESQVKTEKCRTFQVDENEEYPGN